MDITSVKKDWAEQDPNIWWSHTCKAIKRVCKESNTDPKKIISLTYSAIDIIESSKKEEKPFYLQISHYAVHSNIESKESSYNLLKDKPKGAQQKDLGFAAMTLDLDEGLGVLLNKLKELKIENKVEKRQE